MTRLLIVGAGGYACAVIELAQALGGYELVGLVDDRWPALPALRGLPVLGRLADLQNLRGQADAAVLAIGDNAARQAAFSAAQAAGYALPNLVHPRAVVSPSAVLGRGLTVMAGAIIGAEARVDDGAIVNAGAVLDHHAQVGACARLGVGACLAGGAVLLPGASLAAGGVLA